jgi:hypothetical protein
VLAAGMATGQPAAATPRASAGASVFTGPAQARSLPPLQPRSIRPETSGNAVKQPTLPFYEASLTHAGKTYSYTSPGTDPRTSSATTHIPVIFIPIRVYVPGASNWPTGAIRQTTGSARTIRSAGPIARHRPCWRQQPPASQRCARHASRRSRSHEHAGG